MYKYTLDGSKIENTVDLYTDNSIELDYENYSIQMDGMCFIDNKNKRKKSLQFPLPLQQTLSSMTL